MNQMNGTFLGHRRIRCGWAQHKQDTSSCNFGCIDRARPHQCQRLCRQRRRRCASPNLPYPMSPL